MDNSSSKNIDKLLEQYAQRIPAKGMHMGYLAKAAELMDLYGEVLLREEEQMPENEEEIKKIEEGIEKIIKD